MAYSGAILSLAYIIGLLAAYFLPASAPWGDYWLLTLGITIVGIGIAIALPQWWRIGPKRQVWLGAALIAALAPLYFRLMMPQPATNDISKFIAVEDGSAQEQTIIVQGKVTSIPRLTRSQKAQFWLEANQLNEVEGSRNQPAQVNQRVSGNLYVTVPLLQATDLYPGKAIAITGNLYQPKASSGQCVFNFQTYLAKEGAFAGFSGKQISFPEAEINQPWGVWRIQQQITKTFVRSQGIPEGTLASAMVLGNRAVNVSFAERDCFVKVGLAHALAASGFQTSLILGVVLALTRSFPAQAQLGLGTFALVGFVGLTGISASVLRAAIMGFGALVALVLERKVKPLGSLLLAAVLLLIFNPLWIGDLGFQLSFLATLGLLVTAEPLSKKLDWLPPAIAAIIAVPLAATIWTLPLLIYNFCLISPYSILLNVLATPFLAVLSLGGMATALGALIWQPAGIFMAWLLYYPTHWLIELTNFFCQLPGTSIAVGTISLVQMVTLYGLIVLVWQSPWWQRRWWWAGAIAISLIIFPVWQTKSTLIQITAISAPGEPVLIIQDRGKTALVNSGDENTANFTLLPFLQQQGVNQIDWAVALKSSEKGSSGWTPILKRLPVKTFYTNASLGEWQIGAVVRRAALKSIQNLPIGETLKTGSATMELIEREPNILQLQIGKQTWLILGDVKLTEQKRLALGGRLPPAQVLWWTGEGISKDLLRIVKPEVAIASAAKIDPQTLKNLRQNQIKIYRLSRNRTLQWTLGKGFETSMEATDSDTPTL